jgi:hypothetical protein
LKTFDDDDDDDDDDDVSSNLIKQTLQTPGNTFSTRMPPIQCEQYRCTPLNFILAAPYRRQKTLVRRPSSRDSILSGI